MEAFFVSTLTVAIGEIGDKTQLLALLLAARYKKPVPIILGILAATLANHALAGLLGHWVVTQIPADWLRWALGLSFFGIALWTLKPDEMDDTSINQGRNDAWSGIFILTCITFFLAEIGDKTQIATVALAAKYSNLPLVIAGTTLGMMLANVPAVYFGDAISRRVSMPLVHGVAARPSRSCRRIGG